MLTLNFEIQLHLMSSNSSLIVIFLPLGCEHAAPRIIFFFPLTVLSLS